MAQYGDPFTSKPQETAGSTPITGNGRVLERIHSVTYHATEHKLLLDVEVDQTEGSVKTAYVGDLVIQNTGNKPVFAILAYRLWTAVGTMSAEDPGDGATGVYHVNHLLRPGEGMVIPDSPAIISDAEVAQFTGTVVTNVVPDSNMYVDSTADTTEGFADDNDTTISFDDGSAGAANKLFQVNDLIRLDDEICRVTSIVDTEADGAYTPANFIVERAVHGSTKADHTNNTAIRLPFYNAYHDFDKYTVAQTDDLGRFKAMNFFGLSRTASGEGGITPGSIAIQFYESGYQGWSMKCVNSNSESGLTASTEYGFDITVDGSGNLTSDYMKFTTDASNLKFGGSSGIIAKMQSALDTYYYTTSSNILNERVTVSLEGGDVVFRSGSHLSTSAILLAAPSAGETTPFGVGRIPAIGSIRAAVAARLSPETTFDPITNSSTYKQIFIRDDGNGNLIWANERRCGSINYESGAIDFILSEKPNAEFVITCLHTSPFSGKLFSNTDAGDNRGNSLTQVLGNTPQQKCEAILTVETF